MVCTDECNCGTSTKPCRKKVCMQMRFMKFMCFIIELQNRVCEKKIPQNNWCIPLRQDSHQQSSSATQSRRVRPRLEGSGFCLSSGATDVPAEEQQRIKENNDVKVLSYSLVRLYVPTCTPIVIYTWFHMGKRL